MSNPDHDKSPSNVQSAAGVMTILTSRWIVVYVCCRVLLLPLLPAAGGCTRRASLLPTSASSYAGAAARQALVMLSCQQGAGLTWHLMTGR